MTETQFDIQEFSPASSAELARFLKENAAGDRRALYPVGGRTALQFLGPRDRDGVQLSTARLNRVIDYPARDMTITVEAGIRLEDLAAVLAAEHQQLPIDVSHFHRATLGGAVACNTSGPRRFGYGTLRDYVIGITAIDAEGRRFSAGGRVVKNVAGYDLCKLLTGSRGTLGAIVQLTLKVKPQPETSESLWCSCASFEQIDGILERLLHSDTRPVALEVLTPRAAEYLVADARVAYPTDKPVLIAMFEGTQREADWQIARLREEIKDFSVPALEEVSPEATGMLLGTLRDFPDGGDVPLTFQAGLLPSRTTRFLELCETRGVSAIAHAGDGIIVGHFPDEAAGREQAESLLAELTEFCGHSGGYVSLLQAEAAWSRDLDWLGRPRPSWTMMGRVKQALDPLGLMNPGGLPF